MDEIDEFVEIEDSSAQAGWLYTDLLLALMVVFLATISFVPATTNSGSSEGSGSTGQINSPMKNNDNSLTILIKSEVDLDLAKKVQEYFLEKKLNAGKPLAAVQVVGGFDPRVQSEADGMVTAISYASKLRAKNPALIDAARSTISASARISKGQALVRLTFETK